MCILNCKSTQQVKGLNGDEISAYKVSEHLAICPILRGGLGMTEAILDILPGTIRNWLPKYC